MIPYYSGDAARIHLFTIGSILFKNSEIEFKYFSSFCVTLMSLRQIFIIVSLLLETIFSSLKMKMIALVKISVLKPPTAMAMVPRQLSPSLVNFPIVGTAWTSTGTKAIISSFRMGVNLTEFSLSVYRWL